MQDIDDEDDTDIIECPTPVASISVSVFHIMGPDHDEVFTRTLVSSRCEVLSARADCSLKEEISDNKLVHIENKLSTALSSSTLSGPAFENDACTLVSPRIVCGRY